MLDVLVDSDDPRTSWFLHVRLVVYYETIKRELNKRLIYECRCDERLKSKDGGSTYLGYTGLCEGLEHLKIETRLINESFASTMGECVILESQVLRRYSK
jgi:hypothetical protein